MFAKTYQWSMDMGFKTIELNAQVSKETDVDELLNALSVFSYPVTLDHSGRQVQFTPVQKISLDKNGKLNMTIRYPSNKSD
jgi:hypothetical protein